MRIILAVDIVNGKAVKAYAGIRNNYKPLHIEEEDFSNPIKLIQSFQEKINLKKFISLILTQSEKLVITMLLLKRILKLFLNFFLDRRRI